MSRVPNRFDIFLSALGLFFIQHLDGAPHDLLLIPVDAFEGNRDPAFRIEDVSLDAVPIHQGFDEVDAELEVPLARRYRRVALSIRWLASNRTPLSCP